MIEGAGAAGTVEFDGPDRTMVQRAEDIFLVSEFLMGGCADPCANFMGTPAVAN
ncbi:MAG: hypothetical protein ABJ215_13235 [Alphaproteobacteria bacterium]